MIKKINSEDAITAWFAEQSGLSADDFPIGIGDDMAEVRLSGDVTVLITTDMLLDGVHFDLSKHTLVAAAYKSMLVSLSDCAAMATVPIAAVAAVALPKSFGEKELKQIHEGIVKAADKYNCKLIGGDITKWKKGGESFVINVTMLSRRGNCEPIRRNGAKAGDIICVTGELGGSLTTKHLDFTPRVEEALEITKIAKINSMMDISDGLSIDLSRICAQSKTGACIEAGKIPISDAAKKSTNPLGAALNDGEDFELLFSLAQDQYEILKNKWRHSTPITVIGRMDDSGEVTIKFNDGRIEELKPSGYDHLK
ncbi:MAG: thiamine-phosphate kinase [Phycisphaerae bacterium]|nr:thiamine-phosphate kinase [Phycisphaerae bacterium]